MEAYCLKCKEKREIDQPKAGFTVKGAPITQGTCAVCGAKLSRMGNTPAHEGLEKPLVETAGPRKKTTKTARKTKSSRSASAAGKTARPAKKNGTKSIGKVSAKGKKLVIVESPAKARTVGRYLGKEYVVKASIGHVRDLKKSTLSVDVENSFEPAYRVPNEKRALVKELVQLADTADRVYLATDPDREGEAIAWHLLESAGMAPEKVDRVVFHEITESAIHDAFAHPRGINMDLVDAQQARRILDRLMGYNLSPLLWNKVQRRLSAGRVQSVAVKLVVDREREIDAFVPVEYWTVTVELQPDGLKGTYLSRLVKVGSKDAAFGNGDEVEQHLDNIKNAEYWIEKIKPGTKRRKPAAPFTTSTLQQEASKKLGMATKRTMMIAQQLYEGIDLGSAGSTGLITYMRTDSTNIAVSAQQEARGYIIDRFGKEFAPKSIPQYKTKTQRAQEAHEAIRPTSVLRTSESLKKDLSRDQLRLYQLIWQRFVASQMEDAVSETMMIEVTGKRTQLYHFRPSGSRIKCPGFLAGYEEAKDEDLQTDQTENTIFPEGLTEGQKQIWVRTLPEQHFTQPPARFTEATLIKALEEQGIGRPSTYASTLSTIQDRGYVLKEARRLYPTETGNLVTDLLVKGFPDIVNEKFTSEMENELDDIADGDKKWRVVVGDFYKDFDAALTIAKKELPKTKVEPEKVGRACPTCGRDLVIRNGRYGKFISCSGFPECRYTEQIQEKLNVACPKCGKDLLVRRSRNGRVFYGCSGYPECDFTSWKRPVSQRCPECGGMMVVAANKTVECVACKHRQDDDSEK